MDVTVTNLSSIYIEQKKFKLGLIPMIDRNNLIARFPMTSKTKFPMVQKNYLKLLYE